MIEVREAQERLLASIAALPPIEVALADAWGRTLAERVVADRDAPPTDRSAMDGYAARAADCAAAGRSLVVKGEVRAGQDGAPVFVGAGEAVRVFTGAVVPQGADTVVMIERAVEDAARGTVLIEERPERGQHIRRQGEDLRAGATVLDPGARLRAVEIGALAATGHTRVRVVRPPLVSLLSTGDEVVDVSRVPAPYQVRNSNAAMLLAQLAGGHFPARDLGIVGDEIEALDAAIREGMSTDVLLVTGGVSVGAYDLVAGALDRAGFTTLFHTVSMRPGKPILAAARSGCLVLGLPGNPVSAFTSFQVFVLPALRRLAGDPVPVPAPTRATLAERLARRPGRLTYHLARLLWPEGKPVVTPVASSSSGDALSLVRANAFVVAPGDVEPLAAGTEVDVLAWG